MSRRGWLVLALLGPLALIAIGIQLAALTGTLGLAQLGLAARARDSAGLDRGVRTVQVAATILDATWSSPAAWVLESNPMSLGAVTDIRTSAHALAVSARTLDPLAQLGAAAVGFDGEPPLVNGLSVDPARVAELAEPVSQLNTDLAATRDALAQVPDQGLLGRPLAAIAESINGTVTDLATLAAAADAAMPGAAEALGAQGPKRYLVAALNDAEVFGSGGAPLSAFMLEADNGTLSVPIAGQLESKLSPNNPPIAWQHAGGPPWYRAGIQYPFVNSNFHPDFRTASMDMRRAWAALGYPQVDGVITIDMSAIASILTWTGSFDSGGFGELDADNLVQTVLVDAYREFGEAGVLERHARNDELTTALVAHLTKPTNLLGAVRGTMDAIPMRHLQASFDSPSLQAGVAELAAQGALSEGAGDLIAVHSQSAPNKLSVFQDRRIDQEVRLTADGGAAVERTISFANAVPDGLAGDPNLYRGYLALRARMRVAYRLPLGATNTEVAANNSDSLVPARNTGPFPDDRGGEVLWQGHETAPGETTTVVMRYELPAGTFAPGTYQVHADPQALSISPRLTVRVVPAPGTALEATAGWTQADGALVWTGLLDEPLHLTIG